MADVICGRIIFKLSRCEFGAIVKDQIFWKVISTVLDVVVVFMGTTSNHLEWLSTVTKNP